MTLMGYYAALKSITYEEPLKRQKILMVYIMLQKQDIWVQVYGSELLIAKY